MVGPLSLGDQVVSPFLSRLASVRSRLCAWSRLAFRLTSRLVFLPFPLSSLFNFAVACRPSHHRMARSTSVRFAFSSSLRCLSTNETELILLPLSSLFDSIASSPTVVQTMMESPLSRDRSTIMDQMDLLLFCKGSGSVGRSERSGSDGQRGGRSLECESSFIALSSPILLATFTFLGVADFTDALYRLRAATCRI